MKILLINTKTFHAKHLPAMPLGPLAIATYLTDNGHIVRIFDREAERGNNKADESFAPDLVGIAGHSYENFPDALKLSKVYHRKNIPVVWGGQMASLIPDAVLKTGVVDFVVIGEGEITFLALLNAMMNQTPIKDIDGLAYIENGEIVINKDRELTPLSELPIIDFSFINPEKYCGPYIGCRKMLNIHASKGCAFQCTYCYNSCLSKGAWRARPAEYYLSEIKYLVENFKIDGVFFVDDLFGPSPAYLQSVCDRILESNLGIVWGCYTRADLCSKEALQKMHDAGCRWIMFGIESGSEERQQSTKKRLNLAKAKEMIACCREIGIFTNTTFMLGFPDETEEELKQTIEYMQGLAADVVVPNYCGILPKSSMYREMVGSNRIQAAQAGFEFADFKMMDNLGVNYSKIPDRELKVVSAFYYWRGIFAKESNQGKTSAVFIKRAFMQIIKAFRMGNIHSLQVFITAVKELAGIFYYAHRFPGIKKKYGLH